VGFLFLLLLLLQLCYIVPLEELVYSHFIYFFESRLIPTLFLILCWGYQPERVQGGIYLLFYTLLAFLPSLVGILFVYNSLGSLCLFLLSGNSSLFGKLMCLHHILSEDRDSMSLPAIYKVLPDYTAS